MQYSQELSLSRLPCPSTEVAHQGVTPPSMVVHVLCTRLLWTNGKTQLPQPELIVLPSISSSSSGEHDPSVKSEQPGGRDGLGEASERGMEWERKKRPRRRMENVMLISMVCFGCNRSWMWIAKKDRPEALYPIYYLWLDTR